MADEKMDDVASEAARAAPTGAAETDRIERSIVIRAPRARVWAVLSDAESFGAWFGADLKGQVFAPGRRARGSMAGCGHAQVLFDVVVERVEPQTLFSYRWHPYPADPSIDYSAEEPTLVTFTLADAPDNQTRVTVVESGFDKVSPQRRLEAFRMNNAGWDAKLKDLIRYAET